MLLSLKDLEHLILVGSNFIEGTIVLILVFVPNKPENFTERIFFRAQVLGSSRQINLIKVLHLNINFVN